MLAAVSLTGLIEADQINRRRTVYGPLERGIILIYRVAVPRGHLPCFASFALALSHNLPNVPYLRHDLYPPSTIEFSSSFVSRELFDIIVEEIARAY